MNMSWKITTSMYLSKTSSFVSTPLVTFRQTFLSKERILDDRTCIMVHIVPIIPSIASFKAFDIDLAELLTVMEDSPDE